MTANIGAVSERSVDIHAHCVPAPFLDRLSRRNPFGVIVDKSDQGMFVTYPDGRETLPVVEGLVSLEARLEAMAAQRVRTQVLSPFMDLVGYSLPVAVGVDWAHAYNDALFEEAEGHGNRFEMLGTVPLQSGIDATSELVRVMNDLGMVGVEIGSHIGTKHLDDPDLEDFWAEAARRRAIVLLHPIHPLEGVDLSKYGLTHLVGRPAETTVAAARLLFSGVVERHPGMRVVVVHGGGFLPYQIGRLTKGHAMAGLTDSSLSTSPTTLLRNLYFDTVLSDSRALYSLVHMVGSDRVLLGSDYPYAIGDLDPVRTVESVERLSDQDRTLIVTGNATRMMDEARADSRRS